MSTVINKMYLYFDTYKKSNCDDKNDEGSRIIMIITTLIINLAEILCITIIIATKNNEIIL